MDRITATGSTTKCWTSSRSNINTAKKIYIPTYFVLQSAFKRGCERSTMFCDIHHRSALFTVKAMHILMGYIHQ